MGETRSKKILHKSKGSWVAITVTSVLFGVSALDAPQVFANENSVSETSIVQSQDEDSVITGEASTAIVTESTVAESASTTETVEATSESTIEITESTSEITEANVTDIQPVIESEVEESATNEDTTIQAALEEPESTSTVTEDKVLPAEVVTSEKNSELTSDTAPVVSSSAASTSEIDSATAKFASQALMSTASSTTSTEGKTVSVVEETTAVEPVRYDGSNREAVAVNVAKSHFSDSKKVILVNRDKFPDAISATNISQGLYPVLYTRAGKVDQATIDQLKKMPLNEIYILGGVNSVEDKVVSQLNQSTGVKVTRISGRDRYVVNTNAIQKQYTTKEHVVIASGEIYTDALYGVSYANTIDSPVVLSKNNGLTTTSIELLKTLGAKRATLIGGVSTLTQSVESQLTSLGIIFDRIAGANRYNGSAQVAAASYKEPENVVVASGEVFSDALVSAPLAQKLDTPILLVRKDRVDVAVSQYISDKKMTIKNIYIQGGTNTINDANKTTIGQATSHVNIIETKHESVKAKTIAYQTQIQNDTTIPANQTVIAQNGVNGYDNVTYAVTYVNGVESSRKEISRTTIAPITQVVKTGTKEYVSGITVTSNDKNSVIANGSTLQMTASLVSTGIVTQDVEWSVISTTGMATINSNGVLTATKTGKVTVIAKAKDQSNLSGAKEINIAVPVRIAEYRGTKTELVIPEVITNSQLDDNGFVVVDVDVDDHYWWYIKTLADGEMGIVTIIGDSAFKDKQLTSVVLPNSIQKIESAAFANNKLTRVDIPGNVETIEARAFGNNLLTSVSLGKGIKTIGDSAFANNKLTRVDIPGNVETIEALAFEDNLLTSVSLGKGIKTIGDWAFAGNYNSPSEGNQIGNITLPETVTSVGYGTFANNKIMTLDLNEGLIKIGEMAFFVNNIESVNIPSTVLTIGRSAFQSNEIYNLIISNGVTRIEDSAFNGNNLTSVKLPTTLQYIGVDAFKSNEINELVIPNSVTTIERMAFYSNNIANLTLGNGLSYIGESAFASNDLTGVIIPTSVKTIDTKAFYNNNITDITIPGNVTTVGNSAFANNKLVNITIEEGISNIGGNAFVNRSYRSIEATNVTIGDHVQISFNILNSANDNFKTAYISNGSGKYTRNSDGTWVKITA
ncbi:leucine-rich repeat protein [Aerococcus urinaeequi]|uniref:leucine-rich repeat protein n=1 Tax=Aerococcus urinaeequi TaxID=51665 RepID=UPI003AAB7CC5